MANKNWSAQEDPESSQVIFTSIALILLVFFIYLTSHQSSNNTKTLQVLNSLHRQFKQTFYNNKNLLESSLPIWQLELEHLASVHRLPFKINKNTTVIELSNYSIFTQGDEILAQQLPSLIELTNFFHEKNLALTIKIFAGNKSCLPSDFKTPWELAIRQTQTIYRLFLDSGVAPSLLQASASLSNQSYVESSKCNPFLSGILQITVQQPAIE